MFTYKRQRRLKAENLPRSSKVTVCGGSAAVGGAAGSCVKVNNNVHHFPKVKLGKVN